ncbi:hypothetical protein DXG03_003363 [Asterophora parasitica]|uniref:Uncharacterized protein n=1 Tax=Asterophora parasitica TaxID=117018 RepID=A0A9P7KAM0_9AGAR|nr:hypothetical protein DXG03_003363 [Asterophora parasitica]
MLPRRVALQVRCTTPRRYKATLRPVSSRLIRTLNPDLLVPSDFVDLSGGRVPRIYTQNGTWAGPLRFRSIGRDVVPFPSNAMGFLYLHRPLSLPPIAAEIRLRLTPEPNPNLFSTGADLLRDSIPWSIDLARIAKVKAYAPFKALVTSHGLLDRVFMDSLERAWEGHTTQDFDTPVLHTLTEPFEMNLEQTSISIGIITTRGKGRICFKHFFADHRRTSCYFGYPHNGGPCFPQICGAMQGFRLTDTPTGRILVHFDVSPLPEHARPASRPPVLVLRVLKILTPIKSVPGYDMHLPIPVEGGLLSKKKRGNLVPSPIIFDLEKIKPDSKRLKVLRLLVE